MHKTLWNGCTVVNKPWGQYTDIYRSPSVVFKKIDISYGEEISYQYHDGRDEFWYITSGQGILKLSDVETLVEVGYYVHIPAGEKHGIKNFGSLQLTIFEMQCGDCREEDIVRIEDKYDRGKK